MKVNENEGSRKKLQKMRWQVSGKVEEAVEILVLLSRENKEDAE